MKINEFFGMVVYINIDSRVDRNEMVIKEFEKLNINPIRISAITPKANSDNHKNGIDGCRQSHLMCLRMALERKSNILIFEDDVKLINNPTKTLEKALDELYILNMNWDMLYLGGNICNKVYKITGHLGKLTHSQSTHAYGVNKDFVEKLINYIENDSYDTPLDMTYAYKVIPNNEAYLTIPMVAVQQKSFSDIEGCVVEYENWMIQRFYDHLIIK